MAIDYQFSAGHRLDDFKIETPLYKGALAEVYRAIDLMTRQFVVIKVPSSDVINHPLVFYHYQNEMRILSRVRHPNIVGTIQRHRTSAYSIFEYVPGISLRQHLLRRKWMSLQEALHFAQQIARGLGYLHDCGIIHLDIKPDNILITPEGKVKIIDFGLARHLGTPDLLFEDFARPHGTPDYVSPEQLAHHRDDPRADQYSLSLVLYEMLTGRLPFEKSQRLSFVRRRVKIPPIGPRRFRKEIPLAVEAVILKALSVDPGARYGSVAEFGVALQAAGQSADAGRRPSTTDAASSTGSDGSPFTLHCALPASAAVLPCVLAAIDDDGQAEAVADTALQAAMTDGLPVTLLTVVAADAADDWIRYGDEARGKRLSRQLEQLSLKFRHFGIDPSVRIKSGRPADVIIETAKTVGAGLIVAGASRTRLIKRIFGGNTLDRVLKRTNCPVVTAGPVRQPWFPEERIPEELTLEEIRQADTFLTALWIGQIDWLATLVHGLLTESPAPRKAIAEGGPVADWLQRIHARAAWTPVVKDLQCAFDQLMDAARDMAASPHLHERRLLCRIYLRDALPSICRLREALQGISMALRHRASLADEVRPTGLLRRPVCPIEEKRPVSSGPIQQLQALKAHFCSQAVANGDQRGLVADHDHDHGHRV